MTKRQTLGFIIVVTVLFAASVGFNVWRETARSNKPSGSPIAKDLKAVPITAQGVVGCQEPKGKSGSQVVNCPIGLKTDDGKIYALNDSLGTPTQGSILKGKKVRVSGTVTHPQTNYKSDGTILVQTINAL
ncbi:MAG: hypothetical protein ABIQ89_00005 [Candidatus Saccharimonadales bacterium]